MSVSAGARLDARKGEGAWLSVIGREDKAVGIVKGTAWGERVVVREGRRVGSAESDEEDGDELVERTVTGSVRVEVSVEGRAEEEK